MIDTIMPAVHQEAQLFPEPSEERGESLVADAIYIDLDDPFNTDLIEYKTLLEEGLLPTPADQRELLNLIQRSDTNFIARETLIAQLISINRGLISAVCFPYRSALLDNVTDLDRMANEAARDAALTFNLSLSGSFSDYLALFIDRMLVREYPIGNARRFLKPNKSPIASLYEFTSRLQPVSSDDPRIETLSPDEEWQRIILFEHADFLQYIHLPLDEYPVRANWNLSSLYKWMDILCKELGLRNRHELAIACVKAGIPMDLRPLPPDLQLTDHQREIMSHVHLPYEEIATLLNSSFASISDVVTLVKSKLGARTRTEIAAMTEKYQLGPVEYDGPEYLRGFSEMELEVIPYLPLENTKDIMKHLGRTRDSIDHAIFTMMERVGVTRRRQLAVWLYEQGYEFTLQEPVRPLNEVVKKDRLDLWQNAHLTDEELAEQTGQDIHQVHYLLSRGKILTGSRNRTELALVSRAYAIGEFEEAPKVLTKQQKLAEKLGVTALDREFLETMLEKINPRESVLIDAYYFSDESVSWRDVSKAHGLDRTLSIVMARHGVMRIKKMIQETRDQEQESSAL